ncbi:MAG TPA: PorV/PorQ family protein [Flavisolibacter sp.]|nr:PorV/PorQ family protein [Flavisolibacter sp.]
MKLKTIALLSLSILSLSSNAQFRKYSNEFLNIGAGARGLAMGGAQVASVSDGTAGYWNPAGLASVKDHPQANLMHAEYFAGIGKYDYASLVFPTSDNKRTIGVSALRFAVDDIMNTLFLVEPDGSVNYNNIQSFSSADYAFLFSLAQKIKETENEKISFGINAKVIHRSVGSFAKAWGFGLDAGLQVKTGRWHFGASARDITTTFNAWSFSFTEREKEALYLTNNDIPVKSTEMTAPRLVLGGGYDFRLSQKLSLLTEANLDLTFDGKRNTLLSSSAVSVDPKIGAELNINNSVFLRGGINNFQRALADGDTLNQKKVWIYQPSAGAGFRLQNVRIDYAFTNLANQSNPLYTHVFSLQFDLVGNNKKKK